MNPNKTGVLLCNIGTPDAPTPHAVRRYLKAFLSDPRVVEIPRLIWWPILHGIILRTRPKKSAALYQKIWTDQGSPLLCYSRQLAVSLEKKLQIPIALGMHYGQPSIKQALEELQTKEVTKIIVFPLYPQYSATTTAATFDMVTEVLKKWRKIPEIHMLHDYADNPLYINAITQSIQAERLKQENTSHLLFSFHGIPEYCIKAGDPYYERCQLTVELVAKKLNLQQKDYSISFQSRLGRAKWLQPYTDQILKNMPKQGITHLQVVAPGFAVDCLETLEEIAIRGKHQFMENGGKSFRYIPALNESTPHLDALASIISSLKI